MVAALALMKSPAIVVGIVLVTMFGQSKEDGEKKSFLGVKFCGKLCGNSCIYEYRQSYRIDEGRRKKEGFIYGDSNPNSKRATCRRWGIKPPQGSG